MTIQPAFAMPSVLPAPPIAEPPVPATPKALPDIPTDVAVLKYRELRDKTKEISDRHAAELKPYKEAMEMLSAVLLDQLNKAGSNSTRTDNGTVFKVTRTTYSIDDPATFRDWVESQGAPEFYENRVSKEALENWIAEGKPLPPGLKVSSFVQVNIRK